jgi:hypothetical protein
MICERCGDEVAICKSRLVRLFGHDPSKLKERLAEHGHSGQEEPKPIIHEMPKVDKPTKMKRNKAINYPATITMRIEEALNLELLRLASETKRKKSMLIRRILRRRH